MKKLPRSLCAALLAAGLLAGPQLALAEIDALVRDAMALVDTGQAQKAFDLLAPQESKRAGDADFDTVLGIAANATAQYSRAIFALERALLVKPDNARARAELGRALFAVGDKAGARKVFQETKEQGIPVEAGHTIDQFLRAIDKADEAARSSYKGYAELGLGNDSNANSGPGSANVAVPAFGGLVLTLNPGGVKTSASFVNAGAGMSGRYVLDTRWSLIGNLSTSGRSNSSAASAFNTWQNDANLGGAYRLDKNEYSLVGQYGTYSVGGNRLRNQTGAVAEWVHRFDGYRQAASYLQAGRLSYPGQTSRDVDRTVLGSNYAHLFQRTGMLAYGGGYLGRERERTAGAPHLGHKLWGVRAGVQQPLRENIALFGSLGYENRSFGGIDPLFLVTRQDRQTSLNLGVNWSPAKSWRITPQVALVRTASNIVINDYAKRVVSINARYEF
jgi:tetratricopeptide (TPR) repeat protein